MGMLSIDGELVVAVHAATVYRYLPAIAAYPVLSRCTRTPGSTLTLFRRFRYPGGQRRCTD